MRSQLLHPKTFLPILACINPGSNISTQSSLYQPTVKHPYTFWSVSTQGQIFLPILVYINPGLNIPTLSGPYQPRVKYIAQVLAFCPHVRRSEYSLVGVRRINKCSNIHLLMISRTKSIAKTNTKMRKCGNMVHTKHVTYTLKMCVVSTAWLIF